jgi:aspartyl-tRNA(Asn)/glutamyl-tRNA(Gln) amidotransferase subunit B
MAESNYPGLAAARAAGFEPVIGLEVHAQLITKTKAFCGCAVAYGAESNSLTCPVCLGLPGSLPAYNGAAHAQAVRAALALGCEIHETSIFSRKNYFYPDLTKGYQITQYDRPLATGGALAIEDEDGRAKPVGLERLHVEEDTGKSVHEGFKGAEGSTAIDFNRAGTPLAEIVSRPDMRTPAEAAAYMKGLRALLVACGVNDGNLEEGSLRCDGNISLRKIGAEKFGVKIEVKNLNSFRFLAKALDHEIGRQAEALTRGETLRQETRTFDAAAGVTVIMRVKEGADDYRYFPEPDLPPLHTPPELVARLKNELPELPLARKLRYVNGLGLSSEAADTLTQEPAATAYFEAAVTAGGNAEAKLAGNWCAVELAGLLNGTNQTWEKCPLPPARLAALVKLIAAGELTGKMGKEVLAESFRTGEEPAAIVERKGLKAVGDSSTLAPIVAEVVAANPQAIADFKAGKERALGALVGQVMKKTGGKAAPDIVQKLIREALSKS